MTPIMKRASAATAGYRAIKAIFNYWNVIVGGFIEILVNVIYFIYRFRAQFEVLRILRAVFDVVVLDLPDVVVQFDVDDVDIGVQALPRFELQCLQGKYVVQAKKKQKSLFITISSDINQNSRLFGVLYYKSQYKISNQSTG